MLYRDINGQEGYIHICDDAHKYTKQAIKERVTIKVHDISTNMLLNTPNGYKFEHIKYCPYCGAELEKEIENATNEFYKY